MKKLYIIVALILAFSSAYGKELSHQEAIDFNKMYLEFRYSLYPDLEWVKNPSFTGLFSVDMPEAVEKKYTDFYKKHKKRLQQYREYRLSVYQNTILKDKSYSLEKYTNISKDFKELPTTIESIPGISNGNRLIVAKVNLMDPFSYFQFISTTYLARILGVNEFGDLVLKSRLAAPMVNTKKTGDGRWDIVYDAYDYVFFFTANIKNETIVLTKILQRKVSMKAKDKL